VYWKNDHTNIASPDSTNGEWELLYSFKSHTLRFSTLETVTLFHRNLTNSRHLCEVVCSPCFYFLIHYSIIWHFPQHVKWSIIQSFGASLKLLTYKVLARLLFVFANMEDPFANVAQKSQIGFSSVRPSDSALVLQLTSVYGEVGISIDISANGCNNWQNLDLGASRIRHLVDCYRLASVSLVTCVLELHETAVRAHPGWCRSHCWSMVSCGHYLAWLLLRRSVDG